MERGNERKFVLTVLLVIAASFSASILMDSPTGQYGSEDNGECYTVSYDPFPFTTTLTNCCYTTLPNYKWKRGNEVVYC